MTTTEELHLLELARRLDATDDDGAGYWTRLCWCAHLVCDHEPAPEDVGAADVRAAQRTPAGDAVEGEDGG